MSIQRSDLLTKAMIEVSAADGPHQGTGFFVAPRLALTSANLVGYLVRTDKGHILQQSKQPILIHWQDKRFYATIIEFLPIIDLALLNVDIAEPHQCVFIDSISRDYSSPQNLYCFGYPPGDRAGQSYIVTVSGWKKNDGEARNLTLHGTGTADLEMFSGAALLNEHTGGVCAIVVGARAVDRAGMILRTELWQYLRRNFSVNEIKTLCDDMGFSVDDLPASNQGRERITLELIRYVDARDTLPDLISVVNQHRKESPFTASGAAELASPNADIRASLESVEAAYRQGRVRGLELASVLDRPELVHIIDAQRTYHAAHPTWVRSFNVEQRREGGRCYPDDVAPPSDCPYPGLRPFGRRSSTPFRGRDAEVDWLIQWMANPTLRLLVLTGSSGSGKSSLLHAGLLPALPSLRDLAVLDDGVLRLSDQPYTQLCTSLHLHPEHPDQLATAVSSMLEQKGRRRLVVLIDQFEDLLYPVFGQDTIAQKAEQERRQALNLLRNLRRSRDIPVTLLLVVRSEALPELIAVDLQASDELTKRIVPLVGESLRDPISFPAQNSGVDIEEKLVDRLISESMRSASPLPLIQVALETLWHTMRGNRLTLDAYTRYVGTLDDAIQQQAATIIAELSPIQQTLARNMILRLVELRDVGVNVRRPQPQERLLEVGTDRDAAQQTLATLVGTNLLVSDIYRGTVWIELCHEALTNNWSTLRDQWLVGLRECEAKRREWERLIESWRNSDGNDFLTNSQKIEEGTQWDQSCGLELGPIPGLTEFLNASSQELSNQSRRRWTIFAILFAFVVIALFVFYLFVRPILPS